MDLWVVAAAAGAGYIAKNLQNLSVDRRENSGGPSLKYPYNIQAESRNFLQQLRDKTCPLRRLARQRFQDSNAFLDLENHSDVNNSDNDRSSSRDREDGAASVSGEALEESLKFADGEDRNLSRVNRGKMVKNIRCRVHSMRPLSSSGSSLENMEHSTCLCPSVTTVRPVLVTDGRWGNDPSFTEESAMCSSSLKKHEFIEEIRKPEKCSSDFELSENRDKRSSCSKGSETMLVFITGMTIGILSATTSWKSEVDKLNKQLKQMEKLVQDLHEELDMKDLVMVKELADEDNLHSKGKGTPLSIQEPISSPSDMTAKKLNEFDGVEKNEKKAENLELLSRIEAELKAELEMLEQNIKASALERISSVVELDPDFEPEIVEGDLKPTMVNGASDSGNETTETTTNCSKPTNYAVSPWELSLRLYELIESRLETRIKELEIALDNSEYMVYKRRFSYSEKESSSTHRSPTCICDEHDKRQEYPSTQNSSNYVNACKERDEILLRMREKDQEKEDAKPGSKEADQEKHTIRRMQYGEYDSIWEKERSTSFMSNEDSMSEDESSDESDMLLIKKIVERRKSGSSLNLKLD